MDKKFLPLDSPTQDEVELKQQQGYVREQAICMIIVLPGWISTSSGPSGRDWCHERVRVQDPGKHPIGCGGAAAVRQRDGLHASRRWESSPETAWASWTLAAWTTWEQEICRFGADELVVCTDEKQAADSANSVDILLIMADAKNMPYTLFPPSYTKAAP
ncbi:hypothetical protein PF002_g16215 [Phytophthora fragariae]|uniref:Uncharacterized protein n=1 Tax=Phytophthora fragariae TaxID=53985 RepID=A0A6A3ESN5_9STRA|nr:hypothetical protein PF009_g14526 [Phytophthora fragariae]KAE9219353.1 hypothetical protein PF002_g16215 [Phytophthora fragariae]